LFGSCIIHILLTGCAKIKKNNSGAKGLKRLSLVVYDHGLLILMNYTETVASLSTIGQTKTAVIADYHAKHN